jgi:DNA invertase Pin-like site-specific DNA recombinase
MDEKRKQSIKLGMAQAAREGRKPGKQRRDLDLDLIRQRIQNGESLRSVATAFGISPGYLSKRLNESDSFFDEVFG